MKVVTLLVISADYTKYLNEIHTLCGSDEDDEEALLMEFIGDEHYQSCSSGDIQCADEGVYFIPIDKLSPLPGEDPLTGTWIPLDVA